MFWSTILLAPCSAMEDALLCPAISLLEGLLGLLLLRCLSVQVL